MPALTILKAVAAAAWLAVAGASAAAAEPLRLGTVAEDPTDEARDYRQLAAYLGPRVGEAGYDGVEIVMRPDPAAMAQALRRGEVHLYVDSAPKSAVVASWSEARMVLRRWKRGVHSRHAVIYGRADGPAPEPADLAGRLVAADSPFSSSGHLLPLATLVAEGVAVAEVGDLRATLPADVAGFVFTGDEDIALEWVLRGRAAAALASADDFEDFRHEHPGLLRIIRATPPVPRNLVSLSPRVPDAAAEVVVGLLMAMEDTPEGREALRAFDDTTRFDAIPLGDRTVLRGIVEGLDAHAPNG